jgi:hypothetical protein
MYRWKIVLKSFKIAGILTLLTLFAGCKTAEKCPVGMTQSSLVTGRPGPKRIYVPQYYVYRKGKYEFVKGHYRWIARPKDYVKRSLKGYSTDQKAEASVR